MSTTAISDKQVDATFLLLARSLRYCVWHRDLRTGYSLDAYDLTEQCGLVSLLLSEQDDWYSDMPLALIGNYQAFLSAEFLGESEPVGAYLFVDPLNYPLFIQWLKHRRRCPKLYLYFDFDAHGLECADKFIAEVAEAELFVPANLFDIWQRFGAINRYSPDHSAAVRKALRVSDPKLQDVANLLMQFETGLSLETLMLIEKEDPALAG